MGRALPLWNHSAYEYNPKDWNLKELILDDDQEQMCGLYVCNKLTRESRHVKVWLDDDMTAETRNNMMIVAKAILFSYLAIGILLALYYLSICVRYWLSQDLRDYLIIRYGEKDGTRILRTHTHPGLIVRNIMYSILLWPTVLKGYFVSMK